MIGDLQSEAMVLWEEIDKFYDEDQDDYRGYEHLVTKPRKQS